MTRGVVSPGLRRFIETHVETYEEIELLVLLHEDPAKAFSTHEIAARLGMDERSAAAAVDGMSQEGLIIAVGGGHHAAPDHTAALAELSQIHRTQRGALMELLVELALSRLRASNILAFADAFKLKGGQ